MAKDNSDQGASHPITGRLALRYFEEILPFEFDEINKRREAVNKVPRGAHETATAHEERATARRRARVAPLDPSSNTATRTTARGVASFKPHLPTQKTATGDPDAPDRRKSRPLPVPADLTGLALSGGGIRSAAVGLGALQALNSNDVIDSLDYLSTVSGGGYIGASLTAASSAAGAEFPFGKDVKDSPVVGHLRNYSNYLLPRGRSGLRNIAEAAAIIFRGPLVNAMLVLAALVMGALITLSVYPSVGVLRTDGFATMALVRLAELFNQHWAPNLLDVVLSHRDFRPTLLAGGLTAGVLVAWALWRSTVIIFAKLLSWLTILEFSPATVTWLRTYSARLIEHGAGDANSRVLRLARILIFVSAAMVVLDLQPVVLDWLNSLYASDPSPPGVLLLHNLIKAFTTLSAVVAFAGRYLGSFLKSTEQNADMKTGVLRIATKLLVLVASLVLPVMLWLSYLYLTLWGVEGSNAGWPFAWGSGPLLHAYFWVWCALAAISLWLRPNAYSLHRFYRDRLAKAFFVDPDPKNSIQGDLAPVDKLKLSDVPAAKGPYHLINVAMNVQGSAEANRRGRGADFFIFSKNFIGSDLTLYVNTRDPERGEAATTDMEAVDPQLDLATAMAISGAAISANMGVNTMRLLSPTLALLNIRLGYWLRNPRDFARRRSTPAIARGAVKRLLDKFYLIAEMFNLLDETSAYVLLTDGGHIENLGVYELLKRGCQLIVVIDAEADAAMSFPAFIRLERYARIDLGVRIMLPWEDIAAGAHEMNAALQRNPAMTLERRPGPHCAVGRIVYSSGAEGIMVYFKSSLSGDEKDYILDYKRRNLAFPHETTGDQFFSEEQFECYRALGFHMIDGFFRGDHRFSCLAKELGGWSTEAAAIREIKDILALP